MLKTTFIRKEPEKAKWISKRSIIFAAFYINDVYHKKDYKSKSYIL